MTSLNVYIPLSPDAIQNETDAISHIAGVVIKPFEEIGGGVFLISSMVGIFKALNARFMEYFCFLVRVFQFGRLFSGSSCSSLKFSCIVEAFIFSCLCFLMDIPVLTNFFSYCITGYTSCIKHSSVCITKSASCINQTGACITFQKNLRRGVHVNPP